MRNVCNFVDNFCGQNYDLCFCPNHDFNKIFKMNKINTFSTETQRTQSFTENNHGNPVNLTKITVQTNSSDKINRKLINNSIK